MLSASMRPPHAPPIGVSRGSDTTLPLLARIPSSPTQTFARSPANCRLACLRWSMFRGGLMMAQKLSLSCDQLKKDDLSSMHGVMASNSEQENFTRPAPPCAQKHC